MGKWWSFRVVAPIKFYFVCVDHIIGLVHDCNISIANALEILQSCAKPWHVVQCIRQRCPIVSMSLCRHCVFSNYEIMLHQYTGSMGPAWGPSGANRTQVGPMLAPWTFAIWYTGKKTKTHDIEWNHCQTCFRGYDVSHDICTWSCWVVFCCESLIRLYEFLWCAYP